MQLLSAQNLSLTFVTDELFRDVNFNVDSTSRIGLVGKNGSGKTSLFRILTGRQRPSEGQVVLARECRLAYMEQFLDADAEDSLYQAVLKVFAPLLALEKRLEEINALLTVKTEAGLLAEQNRCQEKYADQGGYTYRARLRAALLGLGFTEDDFKLPIYALSGGQRSKAALAKVLLNDANLVLLDEPTNHLDIESIQWLEGFLSSYRGAFILISHDRYFLDKVTTETWDLHHGLLSCYRGNYSAHLEQRESEEDSIRRRYQNQIKEIRRVESIIEQQRRFNQARNYITIASKEKQLERLRTGLLAPEANERGLQFDFNIPPPGGNDVLELHEVAKSFGPKQLFAGADLLIRKGERVFLLGPNGCGKTTLMKIILGREQADRGTVKLGVNIFPTYYDQHHGHITGHESILEHFTNAYPKMTQTRIRTMLGTFLFPGESVGKTLDMLSGGEKARLELMKLILEPANFLLLDEPTNHLDIDSMEAVEQALLAYPGAMLVVSHDRYLINKLADRVYYLKADGLIASIGNYDDLQETLAKLDAAHSAEGEEQGNAPGENGESDYHRRKEAQASQRKRQRQIQQTIDAIRKAEQRLEALEAKMNAPENGTDYQLLMQLNEEKTQVEAEYLSLLEKMEALEKEEEA